MPAAKHPATLFHLSHQGCPLLNFVPYTAQIDFDFEQENAQLSISWTGSDADGDVLMYKLVVREEGHILVETAQLTETFYGPLTVVPGKTYAAEVITTDEFGNYSTAILSEVAL